MSRLKNRKGAVLVMASVVIVVLVLMMAFVMDLSQMYVQVNQEQAAADAAAHAGAIEMALGDSMTVPDSALAYSARNNILTHNAAFVRANVTCGTWDPVANAFSTDATSATCGGAANAVRVVGTDTSQYIFPGVWKTANVNLNRTAVAWVAPGITSSDCVKPWSLPYTLLTKTLQPTNPDTLRDLTQTDEQRLGSMPVDSLTFSLKTNAQSSYSPGNYLPVDIDGTGGSLYESGIASCTTTPIGPGTVLNTETGNMVGPTKQGADSLCKPRYSNGACGNGSGGVGMVIKVPLWSQYSTNMNGKSQVIVKIIGSFSLDTVTANARVVGHFLKAIGSGNLTSGNGTIVRIVLVQ